MLYPELEADYYPELCRFNFLITESRRHDSVYRISVTSHCKLKTALDTFIEYAVLTETENATFQVSRRFSDFDWLMKHLYRKFPLQILPPMPPKRIFSTTDKFTRKFINERMQALDRMMIRMSYFRNCMEDPFTQAFLKAEKQDFILYRTMHKNLSLFKTVKLSIQNVYDDTVTSFSGENVCDVKDQSTEKCFEITYKRISDRSVLMCIQNSLNSLVEEWNLYSQTLLWTAQNFADIVLMSESSEISIILDGVAQFFFNWSNEAKQCFIPLVETMNPLIGEYIAYNGYIIAVLRRRNNSRINLSGKKKSISAIQSQFDSVDADSLPRGNRLDQLMSESIMLEDELADFDKVFFPSYFDWQYQKSSDIAHCLRVIVNTNINYHKSCLDLCKNLLNKIN